MNCHEAARYLPGYLDCTVEAPTHSALRNHLDGCQQCRGEAERYRLMSLALGNLQPVAVPSDLALRIRIDASKTSPWRLMVRHARSRAIMVFDDILAPLALPATGGVLTALAVFVLILQNMLVGVPMGGFVANDRPLEPFQPATLMSLGPLPAPTFDADDPGEQNGLTLDARVNAQGQYIDYRILSGPDSTVVKRQIDQVLLLSSFRPLLSFGRPTDGGHVVINFSAIRVRG